MAEIINYIKENDIKTIFTEELIDPKVSKIIADETGHAYGIKTKNGGEVLLHIGIDTVSMNGNGFIQNVKVGQKVKAGDLLGSFDKEEIKKRNFHIQSS